jgi:hypothetical protein
MSFLECFHCHKKNYSSKNLCQECRFDKNIMATFTEIKKKYKLSESQIDHKKVYHETFRTKYGTEGTSYYLPDIINFVENISKNLSDTNPVKKAVVKFNNEQNEKQKKEDEENFLFNFIWNDVNSNLCKYNIPKDFLNYENTKQILLEKIKIFVKNYTHNNSQDFFVIDILEYLEKIYNRKLEIDEKIEDIIDDRYKQLAKKHVAYKNYIFNSYYDLELCMRHILQDQDKILNQQERSDIYRDFWEKFIEENKDYSPEKYDYLIEGEKRDYVYDNKISCDVCFEKIKSKLFDKMKSIELEKIVKMLNKSTHNRCSLANLEEIYKDKEFKNMKKFSEKIKKDSNKIEDRYQKIISKIEKILEKYNDIKDYLFDFSKNISIFISNNIFLNRNFINKQNTSINKEIYDYSYGKKKSKEACEQIKLLLNSIRDNISKINSSEMKKINVTNYLKESHGCFNQEILNFIKSLDNNFSQEEMIKEVKKFYLFYCMFRNNGWNKAKYEFMKTPIFKYYIEDNKEKLSSIEREFQLYVSKNKIKKK